MSTESNSLLQFVGQEILKLFHRRPQTNSKVELVQDRSVSLQTQTNTLTGF